MSTHTPQVADQSDSSSPGIDQFLPEPLTAEPWTIFRAWFDEAHAKKVQPNPNAMTLATLDTSVAVSGGGPGRLEARIVLAKHISITPPYLVFYTNRQGDKGRALTAWPRAAAVFHWDVLDKQVRIEGPVTVSPESESDAYFASRPWLSRAGAWASDQSRPVRSRAEMEQQLTDVFEKFHINPALVNNDVWIPRPPHWGGYRLWPQRVELWVGSKFRLHDRAVWERDLTPAHTDGVDGYEARGPWRSTRLQP